MCVCVCANQVFAEFSLCMHSALVCANYHSSLFIHTYRVSPHTMRLLSHFTTYNDLCHVCARYISYSYVLTTRAAVRRVAVWRLAGQGDPRTHRHTQQNKTSHSTALSNLLQKYLVTRGQSPTLHLGSSPAPSSGDVGLETVECHHTARLNKAMEGFALNPASLPSIPERKGTLYLRSDHMKYGRATLNSNW